MRLNCVELLAILLAVVSGCDKQPGKSGQPQSAATQPTRIVRIAAAADLKFALEEIASEFQREHPRITLQMTYGSSGNFYSQLQNKAPFDVFLSADVSYAQKLIAAGIADHGSMFRYAVGRIVIWIPNESHLKVEAQGFDALKDASVRKIAIANPAHAPYGRAAQASLQAEHLWDVLQPKLVFGENIAQTAQFVQTGAADAGIIALSLAVAPQMKDAGKYFLIPQQDYPPLEQAGLVLPWAQDRPAADAFRAFLTGPSGQSILKRFGFNTAAL